MNWIAGVNGLNGEEYVKCDTLEEALTWLRDQADEGYRESDLMLYEAKRVPLEVSTTATITAKGLTV